MNRTSQTIFEPLKYCPVVPFVWCRYEGRKWIRRRLLNLLRLGTFVFVNRKGLNVAQRNSQRSRSIGTAPEHHLALWKWRLSLSTFWAWVRFSGYTLPWIFDQTQIWRWSEVRFSDPMLILILLALVQGFCAGISVTLVGHPFETVKASLTPMCSARKVTLIFVLRALYRFACKHSPPERMQYTRALLIVLQKQ